MFTINCAHPPGTSRNVFSIENPEGDSPLLYAEAGACPAKIVNRKW